MIIVERNPADRDKRLDRRAGTALSWQRFDSKEICMPKPSFPRALTFGEIVIGAPWLMRFLHPDQDHDKGRMLQRNTQTDQRVAGTPDAAARTVKP
jgi:hypothetical protein